MASNKKKKGKSTPKKSKKALKVRKKVSTTKSTGKKRRKNRYNAIRSAVSRYCKDTYGVPCPDKELNKIYNELKGRYSAKEWTKDYKVVNEIIDKIDYYLRNKDVGEDAPFPDFSRSIDWFTLIDKLIREDGLYFQPDDTIVLRTGDMDLGNYEVEHQNLDELYYEELYNKLRSREYEMTRLTGKGSPVSSFEFNPDDSDVSGRRFVFDMDMGHGLAEEDLDWSEDFKKGEAIPRPKAPKDVLESKGSASEQLELSRNRKEELERIDKMLEMTIITKKEYKKYFDEIMKRYGKGGKV